MTLAFALGSVRTSGADPPAVPAAAARAYDGPHVVLKGGIVLPGRVVGAVTLGGRPFTRIETHFGHVVARPSDVSSRDEAPPAGGVFHVSEVRMDARPDARRVWGEALPSVSDPGATGYEAPTRLLDRGVPLRLPPGVRLRSRSRSFLREIVRIHRGVDLFLGTAAAGTTLTLPQDRDATISLEQGLLFVRISSAFQGCSIYIRTPSVRIELAEPGRYEVEVGAYAGQLWVRSGLARVDGGLEAPSTASATWREGTGRAEPKLLLSAKSAYTDPWLRQADPPLLDDMCFVPAGRYRLGARPASGNGGAGGTAVPYVFGYAVAGEAEIGAFLIDRQEVTAWDATRFTVVPEDARKDLVGDGRPAHDLTTREAAAWALKAGKRLPTASQWEVAGRGDEVDVLPLSFGGLSVGTWTGEEDGEVDLIADDARIRWAPPATLEEVDASTADVSPFGVEALRSGVPELVRPNLQEDPVFAFLRRRRQADVLAGRTEYVRGIRGSLVALASYSRRLNPGFRCVIDLTPP